MYTLRHWSGRALAISALGVLLGLGCTTRVQHELEEREANRIVAALRQAGVEAQKVKEEGRGGRFSVEVPRGQATRAIQVLLAKELPRRKAPGFGDVYGKASLVPTAAEQQARYLHALSGELSQTLEAIRGVREARVHVVIPRRDPLALEAPASTPRAAVLLRVAPGKPPLTEAEVQRLVAGSVDHLGPARVSVVIRAEPPAAVAAPKPTFAQVGPISVSPDSRDTLQGILGAGLVLILLLAGLLAALVLRLGRLQRALATSPTPREDGPDPADADVA